MWVLEVSMSSITHLFVAGGFVMYPLVIFLVVTLMIGIERFFLYRKFRKDMRQFTAVLNNHPGWIMLPTVLERCRNTGATDWKN